MVEHWTFNPVDSGSSPGALTFSELEMIIGLETFSLLTTYGIIFVMSNLGVSMNRQNIIISLISLELMLLAINMMLITGSIHSDDITGCIFVLFTLTVAATESAIGLALITTYYRLKQSIRMSRVA